MLIAVRVMPSVVAMSPICWEHATSRKARPATPADHPTRLPTTASTTATPGLAASPRPTPEPAEQPAGEQHHEGDGHDVDGRAVQALEVRQVAGIRIAGRGALPDDVVEELGDRRGEHLVAEDHQRRARSAAHGGPGRCLCGRRRCGRRPARICSGYRRAVTATRASIAPAGDQVDQEQAVSARPAPGPARPRAGRRRRSRPRNHRRPAGSTPSSGARRAGGPPARRPGRSRPGSPAGRARPAGRSPSRRRRS